MAENTQFFSVKISSPKEAPQQVTIDATKYIEESVKMIDEDGLIKEVMFDMKQGYLMMDVLSIGMRVDLIGGDLTNSTFLFSGYIKEVSPDFKQDGRVILKITAHSSEGGKLGVGIRDLVYPSKNHPKIWATKEVMFSDIITNLAKDKGIRISTENIKVKKDIKAGFSKGTIRQKNMTDWEFMQNLAKKLQCTLWTEEKNGVSELHLVDDSYVVNRLSNYTFFFLSRINDDEFIDYTKTSDKQIQIIKAKVKLDTDNSKGKFKQVTDPSTGKTKITTEQKSKDGSSESWVLDEAKIRALSSKDRQELIKLFTSGKITWEGELGTVSAKQYFKREIVTGSSRDGEPNNTEVEVSEGAIKDDGISTANAKTENTGSKSYRTVIDEGKLKKLSPEKRSGIMGRIVRGEITEEDREYYKVIGTTPNESKDDGNKKKKITDKAETNSTARKRDAGFSITCTIYGNLDIATKKSYVLEGLGKYSGKYYLYKIVYKWGKSGFIMDLIFTK